MCRVVGAEHSGEQLLPPCLTYSLVPKDLGFSASISPSSAGCTVDDSKERERQGERGTLQYLKLWGVCKFEEEKREDKEEEEGEERKSGWDDVNRQATALHIMHQSILPFSH